MKKDEYIAKYGKTAYIKKQEQTCVWQKAYPETLRDKRFPLFYMGEEGAALTIRLRVSRKGNLSYTDHYASKEVMRKRAKRNHKKNLKKRRIRGRDAQWVHTYIPSSIWWHCEIHHDWKNGGIVYLLSHLDHKEITEKEERVNREDQKRSRFY